MEAHPYGETRKKKHSVFHHKMIWLIILNKDIWILTKAKKTEKQTLASVDAELHKIALFLSLAKKANQADICVIWG